MPEEEIDEEALRTRIQEMQRAQLADRRLRAMLAQILEGKAFERFMNVRISNPELYANVSNALVYAYKKVRRRITEDELLAMLSASTERREGSISVKRK